MQFSPNLKHCTTCCQRETCLDPLRRQAIPQVCNPPPSPIRPPSFLSLNIISEADGKTETVRHVESVISSLIPPSNPFLLLSSLFLFSSIRCCMRKREVGRTLLKMPLMRKDAESNYFRIDSAHTTRKKHETPPTSIRLAMHRKMDSQTK